MKISGPNPSPVPKIKGKYRYAILFRAAKLAEIKRNIKKIIYSQKRDKNVEIYANADPINLM